jgi:hypothetical protein
LRPKKVFLPIVTALEFSFEEDDEYETGFQKPVLTGFQNPVAIGQDDNPESGHFSLTLADMADMAGMAVLADNMVSTNTDKGPML